MDDALEMYVGSLVEHESERALLQEIIRILAQAREAAIVFVNLNLAGRQIDALLCFDRRTVVLEAKGYRRAVRGGANGHWELRATGAHWKTIDNLYQQTLGAKLALRDAMREFVPSPVPPYPSAALVFTPDLPSGSEVDGGDFKVAIIGLPDLERVVQAAPRNSWSLDQWRAFAQEHRLTRVATVQAALDEQLCADERLLQAYTGEFQRTFEPIARELLPFDCKIDTDGSISSEEVGRQIGAGVSLLISGPSGCGKSLVAVRGAIAAIHEGHVSVIVPAKYYETSFNALMTGEVALLGAPSAARLLSAARTVSRAVVLVVDGYNECPPDRRHRLTRCLVALQQRYGWSSPEIADTLLSHSGHCLELGW